MEFERGILFIGRLRRGSNLSLLLRVLKRLNNESVRPWILHVVGVGEEAEQLRSNTRNVPWISWHRDATDQQVNAISRDCLFGCYPGNAGLSVVHMMSLSLPVVIHNDLQSHEGPEPSYVKDGVNGVLFSYNDQEESLYQALRSLALEPARVAGMRWAAFGEYERLINPSYAERLWSILGQSERSARPADISSAAVREAD